MRDVGDEPRIATGGDEEVGGSIAVGRLSPAIDCFLGRPNVPLLVEATGGKRKSSGPTVEVRVGEDLVRKEKCDGESGSTSLPGRARLMLESDVGECDVAEALKGDLATVGSVA